MALGAWHFVQDVHLAYLDLDLDLDLPGEEEGAVGHDADQLFVDEESALHEGRASSARRVHMDLEEVALCRSCGLDTVLHMPGRNLRYNHHSFGLFDVRRTVVVLRIAVAAHHHIVAGQAWAALVGAGRRNLRRT